jgi:hypothetical protein
MSEIIEIIGVIAVICMGFFVAHAYFNPKLDSQVQAGTIFTVTRKKWNTTLSSRVAKRTAKLATVKVSELKRYQ